MICASLELLSIPPDSQKQMRQSNMTHKTIPFQLPTGTSGNFHNHLQNSPWNKTWGPSAAAQALNTPKPRRCWTKPSSWSCSTHNDNSVTRPLPPHTTGGDNSSTLRAFLLTVQSHKNFLLPHQVSVTLRAPSECSIFPHLPIHLKIVPIFFILGVVFFPKQIDQYHFTDYSFYPLSCFPKHQLTMPVPPQRG